jgi:hypothetical protein
MVLVAAMAACAWAPSARAADDANALVRQGAELFKHEDYEGARAAFARAYELQPKAATLFNLALSELNAGHPVEAAAHLRDYLTHTSEPAAKLASVRTKWLPRAEARTARIDLYAPAGAQLAVDGVVQESAAATPTPAGSPSASIVVAAGDHEVSAQGSGVAESQHVTASGGEVVEVHFQRTAPSAADSAPAIGWADSTPPREGVEGTAPRAKWITVLALGSGAVVLAGVGVGFGIAAHNQASDAQALQAELAKGSAWTGGECQGASGSSSLCTQLQSAVDANRRDWTLSTAAYVGAGVLGAASAATWIFWIPKADAVVARPALGPRGAGLVLGGRW